jgi:archaellum component FlaC
MLFKEWLQDVEDTNNLELLVLETVLDLWEQDEPDASDQKFVDAAHDLRWLAQVHHAANLPPAKRQEIERRQKRITDEIDPDELEKLMPPEAQQKHGNIFKLQDAAYAATNTLGLLYNKIQSAARRRAGPKAAGAVASRIYMNLLTTLTKPRGGVFKPLEELFGPADDPRGMRGYITTQAIFAARDEAKAMRRQTGAPTEVMRTTEEENERRVREGLPPMTPEEEAKWKEKEQRYRTTHASYDPEATAGAGHGTRGTARDPMMKPEDQPLSIGGSPFETPMRAALENEKRDLLFRALSELRKQGEKGRMYAELMTCHFGFQRHGQPVGEDLEDLPSPYKTMKYTYEPGTSVAMKTKKIPQCAGVWQMLQFNRYRQHGHQYFDKLPKLAEKYGVPQDTVNKLKNEIIPRTKVLAQEMQKQMNILRPLVKKLQIARDDAVNQIEPLSEKKKRAKRAAKKTKDPQKKAAAEQKLKEIDAQLGNLVEIRDGAKDALARTLHAFPYQRFKGQKRTQTTEQDWQESLEGLPKAVERVNPSLVPLAEDLIKRRPGMKKMLDEQEPALKPVIQELEKIAEKAENEDTRPLAKALKVRNLKDIVDAINSYATVFKPISSDQASKALTEAKHALGEVILTFKHPDGTMKTMPFKEIVKEYAKMGKPETRGRKGKKDVPLKGGLGK